MDCGVYEIRNTVSGCRYVGSSQHMSHRFAEHRKMLLKGKHHSIHLQRAWAKYGEAAFKMAPLAYLEPHALKETEGRLIALEMQGDTYNISRDPTSPMRGLKHKPETLALMSITRKGNKYRTGMPGPLKGMKMTPEQLARRKPRMKATEETKAKMRAARLGKAPANKGTHAAHCKYGHEMSGDNLYVFMRNGLPKHVCRECAKERNKKYALLAARQK